MAAIDHGADSNGDAAERHNVGVNALPVHDVNAIKCTGKLISRHHEERTVEQKDDTHKAGRPEILQAA